MQGVFYSSTRTWLITFLVDEHHWGGGGGGCFCFCFCFVLLLLLGGFLGGGIIFVIFPNLRVGDIIHSMYVLEKEEHP